MHEHSVLTNLEYLKNREKRLYLINSEKITLKEIIREKVKFSEDQGYFFLLQEIF